MQRPNSPTNTRRIGAQYEAQAAQYLEQAGLTLIARNWYCRYGEIDLICCEANYLIFVEVRYRRHHQWGGAIESITHTKQQRLLRSAETFLQQHCQYQDYSCRFDAVFISKMLDNSLDFNWIKNAFGV